MNLADKIKQGQDWRSVEMDVSHIDEQHRKLRELLDTLERQAREGRAVAELESTLEFLHDYAQFHFLNEERMMYEARYDREAYWNHIAEHKKFAEEFERLQRRFREGSNKEAIVAAIKKEVVHWLEHHIREVDQKMIDFLRGRGQGPAEPKRAVGGH